MVCSFIRGRKRYHNTFTEPCAVFVSVWELWSANLSTKKVDFASATSKKCGPTSIGRISVKFLNLLKRRDFWNVWKWVPQAACRLLVNNEKMYKFFEQLSTIFEVSFSFQIDFYRLNVSSLEMKSFRFVKCYHRSPISHTNYFRQGKVAWVLSSL